MSIKKIIPFEEIPLTETDMAARVQNVTAVIAAGYSEDDESPAYMMYGESWTYVITLDQSWNMEMELGNRMGIRLIMHPQG